MGKTSQNKNNTNVYCSVYGCSSYADSEGVKSFHTFPKENSGSVMIKNKSGMEEKVDRRLAWIMKLKMGKKPTKHMRVCSLHFSKSNYIPTYKGENCKKHYLKKTAVPDQNLPTTLMPGLIVGRGSRPRPTRKKLLSEITLEKQEGVEGIDNLLPDGSDNSNFNVDDDSDGRSEVFRKSYLQSDLPPQRYNVIEMPPKIRQTEDKGTQTEFTAGFLAPLNNAKNLNTATGLRSLNMLDALTLAASQILSKTNEKKKRNYKENCRQKSSIKKRGGKKKEFGCTL